MHWRCIRFLEGGVHALLTYRRREKVVSHLCLVGAGSTGLEFAMLAFEDVPVRTGVTQVAVPEYQGCIGLDHLKRMIAGSTRDGHVQISLCLCYDTLVSQGQYCRL